MTALTGSLLNGNIFSFYKEGSSIGLGFLYRIDQANDVDFTDLLIMLKFDDGEIKKMQLNKLSSKTNFQGTKIIALYSDISPDDLTFFTSHKITKIRIGHEGESFGFDTDVSDGKADKIIKSISCIQ